MNEIANDDDEEQLTDEDIPNTIECDRPECDALVRMDLEYVKYKDGEPAEGEYHCGACNGWKTLSAEILAQR